MSREMWKVMEAEAGKTRIAEAEEKGKEKTKKEENDGGKKIAEEQEIWDEEEKAAKLEEEVKKLVLEQFHQQKNVFGKKASERMLTKKLQDHAIKLKEGFVPRKGKVCLLSREEREEVYKFI